MQLDLGVNTFQHQSERIRWYTIIVDFVLLSEKSVNTEEYVSSNASERKRQWGEQHDGRKSGTSIHAR